MLFEILRHSKKEYPSQDLQGSPQQVEEIVRLSHDSADQKLKDYMLLETEIWKEPHI
ncbi:hypothetical protein [Paenibacillus sp. N3.4]|uniref:hypothetical protein n=1 Tax=Paenibacillus sp. N3.4 TaxID=2603222 RepID=UPI00164F663D|nr:hypothetical protein [Paenibacillus sp. N3.4]